LVKCSVAFVVPAYNEGPGIVCTLESLYAEMASVGLESSPIIMSDSSDTAATVDASVEWAERRRAPLVVDRCERRRSLKEALNVAFDRPEAQVDIVVTTVSDVTLRSGALATLLDRLVGPAHCAVAVGGVRPDPAYRALRYRAAAWQSCAVYRSAVLAGPRAVRAEGAFWGARHEFLRWFRYPLGEGSPADDVELARAVARQGVAFASVPDAVVYKVPAGSLRDFVAMTRRSHEAIEGTPPRNVTALRAAALEAMVNPFGFACYMVWRVIGRVKSGSAGPVTASDLWDPQASTKR
jgi:glycosyltransferase involved in cell wall biosynthesis